LPWKKCRRDHRQVRLRLAGAFLATLAAASAVVPPDEAEAEAGDAGPQPPQVAVVLEATVEREEQD